jgi:hypothetical protein
MQLEAFDQLIPGRLPVCSFSALNKDFFYLLPGCKATDVIHCFEQQLHTSAPSVCDRDFDMPPKGAGGGATGKHRQ